MAIEEISQGQSLIEPLPAEITSIQPGGGVCMKLELAWGACRRWYLKRFRPRFVARMLAKRQGHAGPCPHEVLDPRDVKFFRNQGGYFWSADDDPFEWRNRLPFARAGLAELVILGGLSFLLAAISAIVFWPLAIGLALAGTGVVWFFRDPEREIPVEPGVVVSPADGRIVAVEEITDDFVGGRAVLIGVFLSVFNVHMNRAPVAARVVGLRYRRGRFLNALRPESARENERMEVRLEQTGFPGRRLVVRQIAGAIARRIVCWAAPGDAVGRGERFGMIKLGSRTELVLPLEPGLEILVSAGQKVRAGATVLARYSSGEAPGGEPAAGDA